MFYLPFECWIKSDGEQDLGWLDLRDFLDPPSFPRKVGIDVTGLAAVAYTPLETEECLALTNLTCAAAANRGDAIGAPKWIRVASVKHPRRGGHDHHLDPRL